MRRLLFLCLCLSVSAATARTADPGESRLVKRIDPARTDYNLPELGIAPSDAANNDTTFLACYTWDQGGICLTEGWVSQDRTAQTHDFWHVADTAELDGGTFGRLVPLEGLKSMWCGADGPVTAASDRELCSYATLPGYGNNWDQILCLKECLTGAGGVVINAAVMWDSEAAYDATSLEFDNCDDNWIAVYGGLFVWDNVGVDTVSIEIPDSLHDGSVRLRFNFHSDGIWSDADGLWDSDGAFMIDQLSVVDTSGVRVAYEDFEDEIAGTHEADDWISCPPAGYGDFAGLYPGHALIQEDPCNSRLGCMWVFISGSVYNYACGGFPGQTAVPYRNERYQYINNHIYSPDIAVVGAGSKWEMRVDVYRDLTLEGLIFYTWGIRSVDATGCYGGWTGDGYLRYGNQKDWYRDTFDISPYIEPDASHIVISLGVRDMNEFWYAWDPVCHSHAPLFDNAEIYRISHTGPVWSGRDIDMFQDNFSEDGTITGPARADMAMDILPGSSAGILPGDSVVVTVSDPDAGLGFHVPGDTSSGPAVYLYCSIDGPNAGGIGGDLVADSRYNYIGTVSAGGRVWHQIQTDTTWSRGALVENRYNVDLNDNLFVPGDTVWFFFGATNTTGVSTYWALPVPTPSNETSDIELAAANPDEFTILPAGGYERGGDLLYVDGMNFRGAQPFFDTAFEQIKLLRLIDRYDIRGPSSADGNHPGHRARSAFQLLHAYRKIIWNCGDLRTAFSDGSGYPDKSDDTSLLLTFMENLPGTLGGIYLSGDDVADVWLNDLTRPSAAQLRTKYINFGLASNNHVPSFGVSPLGVGGPGRLFENSEGFDTLVVYGGCPQINDFDVLTDLGATQIQMQYHGQGNTGGAVLSDTTVNQVGNMVGFVLSGFSYHSIRDVTATGIPARTVHYRRILQWMSGIVDFPTDVPPSAVRRNELNQNYPNPCNPVTTIQYQVKTDGPVTLKVYNVAGQLVCTLVNETVHAGVVHEVQWRGLNDTGSPVSSGVYFYKLVAGDYTQTRKMVVLK